MNLNLLKGMLIILVVIDHNEFSRSLFPAFLLGFGFHVVGFMTIPFLKPAAPLDRNFASYLFRQYWPFMVVASAMSVVMALATHIAPAAQLQAWALALYSGNSQALKHATGMALLWFLPSFIAMVALRTLMENAAKAVKVAALALVCVVHLFIGTVAAAVQDYLPLGLLPALYVIPLAYAGVMAQRGVFGRLRPTIALALAAALFVPVKYLQMRAHLYNEVGFAIVSDYTQPHALLLNDLEAVTGVLLLFQASRLRLPRLVESCGRYSMQIYLFHAFVALAVYKTVLALGAKAPAAVLFAVSVSATVLLTLALARRVAESRLAQRFLFPRSPGVLFNRGAHKAPPITALMPHAGSQTTLPR
jgi:fucose 4-O-acetylase-like acetyltransferase